MKRQREEILDSKDDTNTIKILTWTVDGLSGLFTQERTLHAIREILKENPDVLFLQEVVDESEPLYEVSLDKAGYRCVSADVCSPYFTLTFVKNELSVLTSQRKEYQGKATSIGQGRDMNCVRVNIFGNIVLFVNCHLESCKQSSATRTAQLEAGIVELMRHNGPAILCGDLNMRDKEAHEVSKNVGDGIFADAWISTGSVKDHRETWVMPGKQSVKCRFDRVYYKLSHDLKPIEFRLVGKELLESPILSTISDHYGIVTVFQIGKGAHSRQRIATEPAFDDADVYDMEAAKSKKSQSQSSVVDLTHDTCSPSGVGSKKFSSNDRSRVDSGLTHSSSASSSSSASPRPPRATGGAMAPHQGLECPPGCDPEVFALLPTDIQKEQIDIFRSMYS